MRIKDIKTGADLRAFRHELGLVQKEFGRKIGYGINRISVVERNNLPVKFRMRNAILKHIKNLRKK